MCHNILSKGKSIHHPTQGVLFQYSPDSSQVNRSPEEYEYRQLAASTRAEQFEMNGPRQREG